MYPSEDGLVPSLISDVFCIHFVQSSKTVPGIIFSKNVIIRKKSLLMDFLYANMCT